MSVPYPYRKDVFTPEMEERVIPALRANKRYLAEETDGLEKEFAEYIGIKHAIAVSSGSAALHLIMNALEIGVGDELLVPANIYVSAADCAIYVGARPVFIEPDPKSVNLDPSRVEELITPKTRAIIVGHMHGQSAEMDAIMEIASKHGITVIEDGAQALGAKYKGKRVGSMGEINMFGISGKGITTFAGGGMVTTNNDELAFAIKWDRGLGPRSQGRSPRNEFLSFNYKMRESEAAVARIALRELDNWNEKRREYAKLHSELLMDISEVKVPEECIEGAYHVYLHYGIKAERRDNLHKFLEKQGIEVRIHYPVNLPHAPYYQRVLGYTGHYPIAQQLVDRLLSLTTHPNHTEEDIHYIANQVKAFYNA